MPSCKLALAAILILRSPGLPASTGFTANLRSSGVVLTNAVHLPDGATVQSGDHITTRPAAHAILTSSTHGRLEVRPDSEARLTGQGIRLLRGAVASAQAAVEVHGFLIRPRDSARSWFAVAIKDGRILVASHRGNVLIASQTAPPLEVKEGSYAQQTQNAEAPPAPAHGKKASAAQPGGWTIGSLSHKASIALLASLGAAAAAGIVLSATLLDDGPSPK